MALDTLEVFGTEYTNVKGFKATDDNDAIKAYIRPQGTKNISANGTGIDVAEYASVDVAVPAPTPSLQTKTKTYTPTESQQTESVTADNGYDGLAEVDVTVNAVSSTYVGSGITRRTYNDITVSGASVTVPAGYYASQSGKSVASGSVTAPSTISGTNATISAVDNGNALKLSKTISVTPTVTTAGYVSDGTAANADVSLTAAIPFKSRTDVTVNKSAVSIPAGYYPVLVNTGVTEMTPPTTTSSTYTGGNIANIDRSTSTQYINLPEGYLNYDKHYTILPVPDGTAGTPTATKGTVSNHSVSVTPSVNNTTGYIVGGTKTGTAVTVSASELVSGSETKTANGTYDVTNLAELVVNVSGGGGSSYQLLGSGSYTVSTTSTSATSVATLTLTNGAAALLNPDNLIYIRIRDQAGVRSGYFFGTDTFIYSVNSNTHSYSRVLLRGGSSANTVYLSTSGYGVYPYSIGSSGLNGTVSIYRRYNSNNTTTINGTFKVDVYVLKGPNGQAPFAL